MFFSVSQGMKRSRPGAASRQGHLGGGGASAVRITARPVPPPPLLSQPPKAALRCAHDQAASAPGRWSALNCGPRLGRDVVESKCQRNSRTLDDVSPSSGALQSSAGLPTRAAQRHSRPPRGVRQSGRDTCRGGRGDMSLRVRSRRRAGRAWSVSPSVIASG